jgi:hypothetical protein
MHWFTWRRTGLSLAFLASLATAAGKITVAGQVFEAQPPGTIPTNAPPIAPGATNTIAPVPTNGFLQILNVQFGGVRSGFKEGPAAVGIATNDFWNRYSRDGANGEWLSFNVLTGLKWTDQNPTDAGMFVQNAPGHWGNGHSDPMMDEYLYPFNGAPLTVTFTNLPPGIYSVYAYGHGGPPDVQNTRFDVMSAGTDFGGGVTTTRAGWLSPEWSEGEQYVLITNVSVHADFPLVVVSRPDASPVAVINGLQLGRVSTAPATPRPTNAPPPPPSPSFAMPRPPQVPPPLPFPPNDPPAVTNVPGGSPATARLLRVPTAVSTLPSSLINVDFGVDTSRIAIGPAATGQSETDFWNLFSRDDGQGGYLSDAVLPGLFWANGTPSAASIRVQGAPGAYGNGNPDPMFHDYLYPLGGNHTITITVSNLPAGYYSVFAYGHGGPPDEQNSVFEIAGSGMGARATSKEPGWNNTDWRDGVQYVLFTQVPVVAGSPLVITATGDGATTAAINGLQLLAEGPQPLAILPGSTLFTNELAFNIVGGSPGLPVRYSLDGSDPTTNSPVFRRPVLLQAAAVVRVRAFDGDMPVGDVGTASYQRVYALDDGIPAEWRLQYFGAGYLTDPRVAPLADPDNDGASNLQEFNGGTNPLDALSGFLVRNRLVPSITWRSEPGIAYRVFRKALLSDTNWTQVKEIIASGPFTRWTDEDVENADSFYIVRPVPAP